MWQSLVKFGPVVSEKIFVKVNDEGRQVMGKAHFKTDQQYKINKHRFLSQFLAYPLLKTHINLGDIGKLFIFRASGSGMKLVNMVL